MSLFDALAPIGVGLRAAGETLNPEVYAQNRQFEENERSRDESRKRFLAEILNKHYSDGTLSPEGYRAGMAKLGFNIPDMGGGQSYTDVLSGANTSLWSEQPKAGAGLRDDKSGLRTTPQTDAPFTQDSIRAALAMGNGPTKESEKILLEHGIRESVAPPVTVLATPLVNLAQISAKGEEIDRTLAARNVPAAKRYQIRKDWEAEQMKRLEFQRKEDRDQTEYEWKKKEGELRDIQIEKARKELKDKGELKSKSMGKVNGVYMSQDYWVNPRTGEETAWGKPYPSDTKSMRINMPPNNAENLKATRAELESMNRDLKPINEVSFQIAKAKQLLASDSPAADVQLQTILTNVFDRTRATNKLFASNRNFGELSDRLAGMVGRFFTGQYTQEQRRQIHQMLVEMESNVITPAKKQTQSFYKKRLSDTGFNESLIDQPDLYNPAGSYSPEDEAAADAYLKGKK